MQLPWHLIYFDELLIMCNVGIASIKINNWIINTKIQSWVVFFFFTPGSIYAQDHSVSFACMFLTPSSLSLISTLGISVSCADLRTVNQGL